MTPPIVVPFTRPDYGEEEAEAVANVVRSGWTTTGPRSAEFERQFAAYTGARNALALNSGTGAMHLPLVALGIGPGDEVITTPLTFAATIQVILQAGATPVLADIGPDLNIDPVCILRACTPRTKAILPVHVGGLPCDMPAIWAIARQRNLAVIEDAAHAVGAAIGEQRIGTGASDAVAFSFYATKNLSTGEGGMVTTGDAGLHERMRLLALHGIDRDVWRRGDGSDSWRYDVAACGFKYNLSDLQSALGLVQLQKLEQMQARRAEIAARYTAALQDIPGLTVAPERAGTTHAWHLYIVRVDESVLGISRNQFIAEMRSRGVECSVHFIPIPEHSYFAAHLEMRDPCTRALEAGSRVVSLPLYSAMRNEQLEHVVAAIQELTSVHA